jgi:hypothetical protein
MHISAILQRLWLELLGLDFPRMPDGSERPVMFASRSLSKSERNYAQIDKEALGIVWSVRKFYNYLIVRIITTLNRHSRRPSAFV